MELPLNNTQHPRREQTLFYDTLFTVHEFVAFVFMVKQLSTELS